MPENQFITLGGEPQYVEFISESTDNPVLLFIHGGPAWPQTPQTRYFNSELGKKYTLVVWEQRGAGQNYLKNPSPENVSLAQIVADGHELTAWLKGTFKQQKIYLAGYSWGSVVGVHLAQQYPSDYLAYIGISQLVNSFRGAKLAQDWLAEKPEVQASPEALATLDSVRHVEYFPDTVSWRLRQYQLLVQFGGAVVDSATGARIDMAMAHYDDYKGYDWYGAWKASSAPLRPDIYSTDFMATATQLTLPVILIQGRQDWNVPSVLAEKWLNQLQAPHKQLIWIENSGHGPMEEQPAAFNEAIMALPASLP